MRRRDFLVTVPAFVGLPALAQAPGKGVRVSILFNGDTNAPPPWLKVFEQQLARHGFVAGKNLELRRVGEWGGSQERVTAAAREVIASRADVIMVEGTGRARIVASLTQAIPIVLAGAADPVGSGLVKDLARPGGNVTGVSNQECELIRKRFELIRELLPGARRAAIIASRAIPCKITKEALLGADSPVDLLWVEAKGAGPNAVLQAALRANPDVIVPFGVSSVREAEAIRRTLDQRRVPIISDDSWNEGAVISLIHDTDAIARSCADQVARILAGARPGDLPVELVAKFELIVNLRRAKEIGLQVPGSILLRADRLVE